MGKGIYLADCQAKSASYCTPSPLKGKSHGIMFLVEAPMGREYTVTQDGTPSSFHAPPAGYDSVVARGRMGPDPEEDLELLIDGHTVAVSQVRGRL